MSNKRSDDNWGLHDKVIAKAKQNLENNFQGCHVVINPGQEKNEGVIRNGETVYPDILYRSNADAKISRLYEVETTDSVNEEEAEQWKIYNSGSSSFYLIVPEDSLEQAKKLVKDADFTIDGFLYYDSNLKISKE